MLDRPTGAGGETLAHHVETSADADLAVPYQVLSADARETVVGEVVHPVGLKDDPLLGAPVRSGLSELNLQHAPGSAPVALRLTALTQVHILAEPALVQHDGLDDCGRTCPPIRPPEQGRLRRIVDDLRDVVCDRLVACGCLLDRLPSFRDVLRTTWRCLRDDERHDPCDDQFHYRSSWKQPPMGLCGPPSEWGGSKQRGAVRGASYSDAIAPASTLNLGSGCLSASCEVCR